MVGTGKSAGKTAGKTAEKSAGKSAGKSASRAGPTAAQRAWLTRGLDQPGGKLPLFDHNGQRVSTRMVRACMDKGWAEPWFENPLKPDWLVCKLTADGRKVVGGG
ncbi:hypothetical protein [Thalassobaculum salexigens]|uniref:hypothetical protein n=1 Tax=Thalassobaculum salexigens TaxID=455360 RepID=UPI003CCB7DE9